MVSEGGCRYGQVLRDFVDKAMDEYAFNGIYMDESIYSMT